jgi:ankyrin repeat protein
MPKKKTTLPKNFRELCQVGDLAALQAIYADTDINATERGGGKYHPLAMRDTPPAFMQWLLNHGADANFRRDAGDSPPLYHQVTAGNAEHAAVLLRNGANANYTNEYGNSILHFAATAPLVKLLLAHGANPAAKNKRGKTPLDSRLSHATDDRTIAEAIACVELYLQAGIAITEWQREKVAWQRDHYNEHMARFEIPHSPEGYAALRQLCELFGVSPAPVHEEPQQPDLATPIALAGGTLWEQYISGWGTLVPPAGHAATVQGEIIRIAGRIRDELLRNAMGNWNSEYRKMLNAFPRYTKLGNPLSAEQLAEIAAIQKGILDDDGALSQRLCELAAQWVAQNPAPMALGETAYKI